MQSVQSWWRQLAGRVGDGKAVIQGACGQTKGAVHSGGTPARPCPVGAPWDCWLQAPPRGSHDATLQSSAEAGPTLTYPVIRARSRRTQPQAPWRAITVATTPPASSSLWRNIDSKFRFFAIEHGATKWGVVGRCRQPEGDLHCQAVDLWTGHRSLEKPHGTPACRSAHKRTAPTATITYVVRIRECARRNRGLCRFSWPLAPGLGESRDCHAGGRGRATGRSSGCATWPPARGAGKAFRPSSAAAGSRLCPGPSGGPWPRGSPRVTTGMARKERACPSTRNPQWIQMDSRIRITWASPCPEDEEARREWAGTASLKALRDPARATPTKALLARAGNPLLRRRPRWPAPGFLLLVAASPRRRPRWPAPGIPLIVAGTFPSAGAPSEA